MNIVPGKLYTLSDRVDMMGDYVTIALFASLSDLQKDNKKRKILLIHTNDVILTLQQSKSFIQIFYKDEIGWFMIRPWMKFIEITE